jgi:hypothetical protein
MLRKGRRILLFLLTPLAALTSAAIGVYLKIFAQSPSWWIVGGLATGLVLATFIASYFTYLKPLRDIGSMVTFLLELFGNRILEYGRTGGVELRLNVLLAYRPFKFFFFIKYLKMAWSVGMKYARDETARFRATKGVAGNVFSTGNALLVNLENPGERAKWGFSQKELATFPEHTMIWGFPIYRLDKDGKSTGVRLGAVNLDSLQKGAFQIVIANQEEFRDMMEEFQDIISKVASC